MREEGRDPSDQPTRSFSTSPSSPFTGEVGEEVFFKPYDSPTTKFVITKIPLQATKWISDGVCIHKNHTKNYKRPPNIIL